MPHHQWQFSGIDRYLIKHTGVITMERLATGSWIGRIERAGALDDGATDSKTTLFLNDQGVFASPCAA